MRKPRLSIEVIGALGAADYRWKITHNGKQLAESEIPYATADLADEAAEIRKVELQEAMMKAEPKPPKEKKPRKVKSAKAKREPCKYISVTQFLFDAIEALQTITIGDAGDNIDRLRKAAETIENVRKDLSEIE